MRSNHRDLAPRFVGSLLALAVVAIHVIDQRGFPGDKSPAYMAVGYYLIEVVGVIAAALLLAGRRRFGWFLSLGVAAGPAIGFVLSRAPGLPGLADDRGNWTEPLGLLSLVVETALLVLSAAYFARQASPGRHAYPREQYVAAHVAARH